MLRHKSRVAPFVPNYKDSSTFFESEINYPTHLTPIIEIPPLMKTNVFFKSHVAYSTTFKESCDQLLHHAARLSNLEDLDLFPIPLLRPDPGGRHVSDVVCREPLRGQGATGHAITRQTHKKSIKHCRLRAVLSST